MLRGRVLALALRLLAGVASWLYLRQQLRPDLRAMSPADAATAQARAAELLGKSLDGTRALLGCD